MEAQSQVNQEARVSSKDDLDANMNETPADVGEDSDIISKGNVSEYRDTCIGQHETAVGDNWQPASVAEGVVHPPGDTAADFKQIKVEGLATTEVDTESLDFEESHEELKQPVEFITTSVSTTDNLDESKNGKYPTVPQNQPSIPNLTISIKTEFKSDSSNLTSPTMSSAYESAATSPMPSPASSLTSVYDITSSRSLSTGDKYHGKRRRRGSAWTDDETEYLLEIWAKQTEIMKERGTEESVTSAPVYKLISRSLAELGWEKTWEQCKTRIHTLKRAYKITKDEIESGSQTVTYCRHFDKLEIIMGDNPSTTPGTLAVTLEQKRKQRGTHLRGKKIPVRRKLTVGENPNLSKRSNTNSIASFNRADNQMHVATFPDVTGVSHNESSSSTAWYSQISQIQSVQQPVPPTSGFTIANPNISSPYVPPTPQPAPQYPYSTASSTAASVPPPPPYSSVVEVNNNKISVKSERDENSQSSSDHFSTSYSQWNTTSTHGSVLQAALSQPANNGNELERMRLDLEMKKLEVERNKIEMEERQRREDRDHQYRMLQLLLFGLGQQNISQLLSGQGGSEMTHAQSANILRALENGLVPGGSQKVNEKGLSFNEL